MKLKKITNVSKEGIGLNEPVTAFLKSPEKVSPKALDRTWIVLPAKDLTHFYYKMEAEGRITIEDYDPKSEDRFPKMPEPVKQLKIEAKEKVEAPKEVVEKKVEKKEVKEKPPELKKPAVDLTPEPKPAPEIPSVGSTVDGGMKAFGADVPGTAEEAIAPAVEGPAPETTTSASYSESDLRSMSMRDLRGIIAEKDLGVKSTHKDVLVQAVLDAQEG